MKLYTAVLQEINIQKQFSAYNITKSLRDRVNNSLLIVDDVDQIDLPTGEIVSEILHDDVNSIVQDIYNSQVLDLTRQQGPGFFVYTVGNRIPNIKTAAKSTAPNPVKVLNGFSKSERHQIYTKVATYVSNKRKNKEKITIRGINSALKVKGVDVQDILDVCNKLGYVVVNRVPKHASEVK